MSVIGLLSPSSLVPIVCGPAPSKLFMTSTEIENRCLETYVAICQRNLMSVESANIEVGLECILTLFTHLSTMDWKLKKKNWWLTTDWFEV